MGSSSGDMGFVRGLRFCQPDLLVWMRCKRRELRKTSGIFPLAERDKARRGTGSLGKDPDLALSW
jgi:hypothetical protein